MYFCVCDGASPAAIFIRVAFVTATGSLYNWECDPLEFGIYRGWRYCLFHTCVHTFLAHIRLVCFSLLIHDCMQLDFHAPMTLWVMVVQSLNDYQQSWATLGCASDIKPDAGLCASVNIRATDSNVCVIAMKVHSPLLIWLTTGTYVCLCMCLPTVHS